MLKKSRIAVLVIIFIGIMAGYTFQLMQYQIVNGESYRVKNSQSSTGTMEIVAPRGDILDRYGRVLATSEIYYSIVLQKAYFPTDKDKQNTELLELTKILTEDQETWIDELPISTTAPYTFTQKDSKIAALIKYFNSITSKKIGELSEDADATTVYNKFVELYGIEGYDEQETRTLVGIRYSMGQKYFSTTKVYTLAEKVSKDTITKIEERSSNLPGTVIQQDPERYYPDGTIAPHIIGITGRISETELKDDQDGFYDAEDSVGKFGIEKSMEEQLRGVNGEETIEQDSEGNVISKTVTKEPQPGNNVILSIDKDMQINMQNNLPAMVEQVKYEAETQNRPGKNARGAAAVAINIKTGEILAMATYPSYDLNSYYDSYSELNSDSKMTPLLNRCIQGIYRPGSTFKPVVAVAGLRNGDITEDTYWNLPAELTFGTGSTAYTGHDDENMARANVNVTEAIRVSSNIFFMKLASTLGITKIGETAADFGIGKKTGVELPSENAGTMSSPELKLANRGVQWFVADTAQASIGQYDTMLTPLQLANYVSTLVKNGQEYQVHIVRQVNSYDNSEIITDNTTPQVISDAKIDESVTDVVKKGMLAVTESGTAQSIFSTFAIKVGGKTGTSQITVNDYNGVFVCFAPYDDPEIAVATVIEYGHNGYQTAPVAKSAIQDYLQVDEAGNPLASSSPVAQFNTILK